MDRHCLALIWPLWALICVVDLPVARAQSVPPGTTVVTVKNMHCANCAQKIARKLYAVPGVVRVATNVKANTAVVTPQPGKSLSSAALWDAVEKAGFQVVKVQGPGGTFTAKPSPPTRTR